MDFFDKLTGKYKDKNKKKGIVGKIIAFITLMSALPVLFNVLLILLSLALIFVACAGIMQYFQEEEPIVGAYDIDWGNYTCTCTFLTAEQILQVQAGNSVNVDLNAGSLNISGDSVVNANGLIIPYMGYLKQGIGQYGIPIWSGYSKEDTGTDVVVGLSIDTRTETMMSTSTKNKYESVIVNEQMANGPVSRMLTGDVKLEDGRLCVALASGVIAWPDDPDRSNSMLNLDVDIVLKNGEVIPCRIKDAKANVHTGSLHVLHCGGWGRASNKYEVDSNGNPKWYKGDRSVIELYSAPNNTVPAWLSSYIKSVGGYDHIKVYNYKKGIDVAKTINPYSFDSVLLSTNTTIGSTTSSFGSSSSSSGNNINENIDESFDTIVDSNTGITSTDLTFTNGQKISLDSSWKYANESVINSGSATYYTAISNRKDICVAVNPGHGTSGNSGKKTKSHPDGTGKYTGGTNAQGAVMSQAISSGTTLKDNTPEAVANLRVAKAMKDELLSMGYDVIMIRETDDEQLDNIARTVISNNIADCHVAIHFDGTNNDKGAFYMSVVDNDTYKNMEPVKTWWKQHDELGEALLIGLSNNNVKLWSSRKMESDLTQTSYSTIPSVDIELGDTATDISQESCDKFGVGLALGVDEFFKTHNPVNQSKRIGSVLGNISSTGNSNTTISTNISNTVVGGLVNKNKGNLRTQCSMEFEGLCGCYVSDPNCACHIFGGSDGILGNDDDNIDAIENTVQSNTNLSGLTSEQQFVLTTARDVMSEMVIAIKTLKPSVYERAKTSSGNPWYTNLNGGAYSGNLAIIIDGDSFGVRPDCSGYVGAVLNRLGYKEVSNPSTETLSSDSFISSMRSDDRFIVLDYNISILQPGDIVIKRGSNSKGKVSGHTEILHQLIDVNNNSVKRYSWGSTGSVLSAFDINTGKMKDIPDTLNYSYYRNGYKTTEYIIRYVGSGGQGK